jgi:hypothetical protein
MRPLVAATACVLLITVAAQSEPPEATPTPAVIRVGNTGGQTASVYLYNSPTTGDRIQAYPEGTPLLVVGGDVEGDGLTWHYVRAPDGTEGYIPVGDTASPEP